MQSRSIWTISLLALVMATATTVNSDDPEFRLLRDAQRARDGAGGHVRLVQLESAAPEIEQPADFGGDTQRTTSLRTTNEQGELDFTRLEALLQPKLPSAASSSVSTPAEVAAVEQATGQRIGTGVVQTAPVEIVPASTFSLVNIPDVTESIIKGATTPTMHARRRSPISLEPRVRGYGGGQLYTTLDGAFIGPVRNDLDGVLSKVDKSLIGSTEVISGPYGLRYGSGFSFITVDTVPTPRYECGWENHVRLGSHLRTNGGQTYNTATVLGGGQRMGYFANIGYRKGSDYEAGGGLKIPSSYDAFNIFSGIGFDLDEDTRMVTKFTRLNQGPTEYAAQFFDVNNLDFYGINHSIIHQNERTGFGYRVDGWYSNTTFDGDTDSPSKRRNNFPVLQRVDDALKAASTAPPPVPDDREFSATVDGDIELAGIRAGVSRQFDDESSVSAGADFRYVRQAIDENYNLTAFGDPPPPPDDPDLLFSTGLPRSEIFDPGLYIESATGMTDNWNIAAGARLAFASTRADPNDVQIPSNFRGIDGEINRDLDVSDILGSVYLTNDLNLTNIWRARLGAGYAERLPDLTERYSDGLFLSVIQSGFSRVIGTPELKKERNWQIDIRFDGEYERSRVRFSAFNAWISDYITYAANLIDAPLGARLLRVINTDYATLAGFETYGEYDIDEGFQSFGSLAYLDGRDREIHQPLSGISPLEGRVGLRWFDINPENAWGMEFGCRIVNDQDRLGTVRPVSGAGTGAIQLEAQTPGFTTAYIRGYVSPSDNVNITAGVENLFDKEYLEHLSLRLPAGNGFPQTSVLSPGITPYVGIEMEY